MPAQLWHWQLSGGSSGGSCGGSCGGVPPRWRRRRRREGEREEEDVAPRRRRRLQRGCGAWERVSGRARQWAPQGAALKGTCHRRAGTRPAVSSWRATARAQHGGGAGSNRCCRQRAWRGGLRLLWRGSRSSGDGSGAAVKATTLDVGRGDGEGGRRLPFGCGMLGMCALPARALRPRPTLRGPWRSDPSGLC